jgi:hypothetical protein
MVNKSQPFTSTFFEDTVLRHHRHERVEIVPVPGLGKSIEEPDEVRVRACH